MKLIILVFVLLYIYYIMPSKQLDEREKLLNMVNMFENNKLRNNLKKKIYEYMKYLDMEDNCEYYMGLANTLRYEIMDMARSHIFTWKRFEDFPIKSFQVQLYKIFFIAHEKCKQYQIVKYKAANEFDNKTSWNQ